MSAPDEQAVFESVFANSPDAMAVTVDDRIVQVNPAFERVFGWSRAHAIGQSAHELALWQDAAPRGDVLDQVERIGSYGPFEMRARHRDGRDLDGIAMIRRVVRGGRDALLWIMRDVTLERRALALLAQSEARQRGFVEAAFEGIGIGARGRLLDVNEQLAAMLGYTRAELMGMPVEALTAPESLGVVRDAIASGHQGTYEHVALRKDGSRLPVEVRARVIEVAGEPMRVTVIRDMTERKRAEAETRRLMDELRARNAEMEQFVYTVSHDLKSPLVTIKGFLGALRDDLAAGRHRDVDDDLGRIGSAADRMMVLLDDLLELSRVGRVRAASTTVPLADVVREALELVDGRVRARGVAVTVAPDLPAVHGDRGRLVQLVQNLIENATKYMGAQPAPAIEIAARPDPVHAILAVRDNGIGVEPRHAERVFGLFEKLDPRSEGTGVGLALVRRIAEAHGGRVWIESDGPGRGSTFLVALPRPAPAS